MTIAIGFRYSNGVLLCADTEVNGWVSKTQAAKIATFQHQSLRIGMAYAGNTAFALSAMQAIERKLKNSGSCDAIDTIMRVADKEYRRTVLSHPGALSDPNLAYWLIVAVCGPGMEPQLLESEQTSLYKAGNYACTGIGQAVAHHLIRSGMASEMGEREIVQLAAYTLATVKSNVTACGGFSHYVALRKDGTVAEFFSAAGVVGAPIMTATEYLERNASTFDMMSREVLFSLTSPNVTDEAFDQSLQLFNTRAQAMRTHWRQLTHVHESLKGLIEGDLKTIAFPEGGLDPRPTKADPSRPQPSPGSRGGSDES